MDAIPKPYDSRARGAPPPFRARPARTWRSGERWLKITMIIGVVLALLGGWRRDELPRAEAVLESLYAMPAQTETHQQPFEVTRGGVTYQVKPLYDYEIRGLVVSRHSSDAFTDFIHEEWGDHLNVLDLCLVYGAFARSGDFRSFKYSSGNFTCFAQLKGGVPARPFPVTDLSNNHLLSDDPQQVRALRQVRIGDQIRLKGYLARYAHTAFGPDQPFGRGSSVTRTDVGDGACETIYVTDFEVLTPASQRWRTLMWIGIAVFVASLVALIAMPYRSPD